MQSNPLSNNIRFHIVLKSVFWNLKGNTLITISLQYKNANIASFVLAVPFKIKKADKVCNIKGLPTDI